LPLAEYNTPYPFTIKTPHTEGVYTPDEAILRPSARDERVYPKSFLYPVTSNAAYKDLYHFISDQFMLRNAAVSSTDNPSIADGAPVYLSIVLNNGGVWGDVTRMTLSTEKTPGQHVGTEWFKTVTPTKFIVQYAEPGG
jgi:hypothetical protein